MNTTTTTTTSRIARIFAVPFVAAGLLAGAFCFSAAAHAGTYSPDHTPRPGIVATPDTHAQPVGPGTTHHRHGYFHVQDLGLLP
ncbi:hypothetical protein H7J88_19305 [Mycolicibacterium flavescens]|uniref:Secreted protein n=1 Tax=Mycolicibacterium flavescens TaxID=1776 RepID=A0A1E3RLV4_MYCFV|nr:hypothetical protein [Mycolicibacterium flavescens]MCV7281780.1 hypothetical protein [Mycolicibacterium flavescens]ODQ90830.1 hypothetical protein BHQ18_08915 [Mycolicibacterium flavescens]